MPSPVNRDAIVKSGSSRTYGPVFNWIYGNGVQRSTDCHYRKWYVGKSRSQARDYTLAWRSGSYSGNLSRLTEATQFLDGHATWVFNSSSEAALTRNKRFARFLDKVRAGDSASMGSFVAESKESVKMIAQRAGQLAEIFRALKSRNVSTAVKLMNSRPRVKRIKNITVAGRFRKEIWAVMPPLPPRPNKPHPKKRNKSFSELLLEFDYGWTPFVEDIFDFAAVLNSDACPPFRVEASASVSIPYTGFGADRYHEVHANADRKFIARCGGQVRAVNPWLFLASRMGVVNPAEIAWNVVPFTFFVDQFVNIGAFLEARTAFSGLEFSNYYETEFLEVSGSYSELYYGQPADVATYKGIYVNRKVLATPTLPTLVFRGNPYEENPRNPDSLKNILRNAVDHLAVCATLLSSAGK